MYPYMFTIHPHSKRLSIIHAETYASAHKYDLALEYLQNYNGLGFDLQRLYINCNKNNKLRKGIFLDLINNNHNLKIGTYEMEGIISMANLGLDNKCLFSKIEFVNFLSTIAKLTTLKNIDLQKINIYEAHYHHELGYYDKSINALERSFQAYQKNPIPLFLMVEYHVEQNQLEKARTKFVQAKIISDASFYDYSDFITRISPMISTNNSN
jgi:tetratricopeptide (TPR) repeat protein